MASRLTGSSRLLKQLSTKKETPFRFTPNYQLGDKRPEILEAMIPDRPDVSEGPVLRTAVVRPEDVSDLVLRPGFNDLVVTALAEECAFSGDENYKLTSTSSVKSSKLWYANIATAWMSDFNELLPALEELKEIGVEERKGSSSFLDEISRALLADAFAKQPVLSSVELQDFIEKTLKITNLESSVEYLLSQPSFMDDIAKYELLITYLKQNLGSLGRQKLPEFLDLLMTYASADGAQTDRIVIADSFIRDHILDVHPEVLVELPPHVLNLLADFANYKNNIYEAKDIMSFLVAEHRVAPARSTFEQFMFKYCEEARRLDKNKEQILHDLTCIKPILHFYGLDVDSFELLLSRVIDNSYDLAHFVRLALKNSAELLAEYAEHILLRLRYIHKKSHKSEITKAVETTQFVRLLVVDNHVRVDERLGSVLRSICDEHKIAYDDLTFPNASA